MSIIYNNNLSPLASKIAELIDECDSCDGDHAAWRGVLDGEEWKIIITHKDLPRETFQIIVKRRDQI
jgi:hypothetical protein